MLEKERNQTMKATPVNFHLTMNEQERAWLVTRIEYYFTNAINGTKNLFGCVDHTIRIMEILRQIKNNSILISVSHYDAKLLMDVIYLSEKRWHVKKNCEYLPDDFNHRDIYDQLEKLSKRELS
jgi:hypothetical protein